MKVESETIWTYVTEFSSKVEEDLLKDALLFEVDGEYKNHFDASNRRFYTGLIDYLVSKKFEIEHIKANNTKIVDEYSKIEIDNEILNNVSLRDYQISATKKALFCKRGIIQVATGGGKTILAASVIAHINKFRELNGLGNMKCTIITPSAFLMEQMAASLESFGIENVFRFSSENKPDFYTEEGYVAVFVINSAYSAISSGNNVSKLIKESDLLILDEAHHASADTWVKVLKECRATLRFAYTATVYDRPGSISYGDLTLIGLIGRIIFEVSSKDLRNRGYLADPLVTIISTKKTKIDSFYWKTVYEKGIVNNKERNLTIAKLARGCYFGGNKVMIFVIRKKHGHTLAKDTAFYGCPSVFIQGGGGAFLYNTRGGYATKKWSVSDIASYIDDSERCVLITTVCCDEGVDLPSVNVLIIAGAGEKYRRTVQRSGRGMRPKDGQNKVFIFDFWDTSHVFLMKHSEYRLSTYRDEEFDISDSIENTEKIIGCSLNV